MIRFILLSILLTLAYRAIARLASGILRGMQTGPRTASSSSARGPAGVPQRGVQMVRDPICGTFVVPANAVAFTEPDGTRTSFCSAACRDRYREQVNQAGSRAHGRTA